ncbi:MAG: hypothetical protein PHS30_06820 [Bacteroidales bacterium]|nr:hypothetical protein [Bacteroidales bacterium]
MNIERIIKVIIGIIIAYAVYFIVDGAIYSHSIITDHKEWKEYVHLFQDSIVKDVDTLTACSYVKRKDVYISLNYVPGLSLIDKDERIYFRGRNAPIYFVVFWEFKSLSHFPVDSVEFRFNQSLEHLEVFRGEVLEPKSEEPVSINYGYTYKKLNVNVDNQSSILNASIKGRNYKGFFGKLNRISFSNEKEKHKIFIDYYPKKPVLFLVANKDGHFYLITISCNKKFDESIVNILNLN